MRKVFSVLLLAFAVFCAVWIFRPELLPWENIITGVDTCGAAQLIRTRISANPQDSLYMFRDKRLDRTKLFRALESIWPYAFSLSTTTRQNGMLTVQVQMENAASQHQASVLAQGIADNLITRETPLRERLRLLHDYVIKNSMYDTETASRETLEEGSGADAPFTAAGALVDGKAVCAGYARAFMQLCDAAGIDVLYIADEQMNHGWNVVRVYDEILYIDTTFDDPVPDRGKQVSTEFFLKTAEEFSGTHTWDRAFYDPLVACALPEALGPAQRLYDLGLLSQPPRTQTLQQPLSGDEIQTLSAQTGMQFAQDETIAAASLRVWQEIENGQLAGKLLDAGAFDEVRARQVGIPESSVQTRKK